MQKNTTHNMTSQ